ncbi:uncharacterized protein CCOS01_15791 [Colletotrichum costaricense]|uniref:Uncharacterized protein n=1 Tax=Colletotrichum costaricense TaxID=1209916 RepID=A0AAI9YHM1_9PEZI|nr:uncharacterized protein CCOS01_15791 [Colletotrichum costaricense]KAK1509275.1 hypothetical protein CCOS01_15791 [Colletotrichum costaricense]
MTRLLAAENTPERLLSMDSGILPVCASKNDPGATTVASYRLNWQPVSLHRSGKSRVNPSAQPSPSSNTYAVHDVSDLFKRLTVDPEFLFMLPTGAVSPPQLHVNVLGQRKQSNRLAVFANMLWVSEAFASTAI